MSTRVLPRVWIETDKPGLYADTSDAGIAELFRESAQLAETHGNNELAFKLTAIIRKKYAEPKRYTDGPVEASEVEG